MAKKTLRPHHHLNPPMGPGYTFSIGNSIFNLSLELPAKFWKMSLKVSLQLHSFIVLFIHDLAKISCFERKRHSFVSVASIFFGAIPMLSRFSFIFHLHQQNFDKIAKNFHRIMETCKANFY